MFGNKINLLGYDVSTLSIKAIVAEALSKSDVYVVNTINPHSYVEAKKDYEFNKALLNSDVLIPDGSGISLAAKVLKKVSLKKIAGFDLFQETMQQLNETSGTVFFLGSTNEVLLDIRKNAEIDYPNVKVEFLSPPYKAVFEQSDIDSFILNINEKNADVLFVGLTAPKQEKLIEKIKEKINVKMVSGIGAVFDFYAGHVIRPSQIWLTLHLEWLIRLIGEPKRLWRRNFISTPIFLKDLGINKISLLRNK
ncbi:TPA: WecB/TagA/CpsF family glycosyltransferase [Photobacterium damselae]